jgi:cytoskeletal protein RodZ
MDKLLEEDMGVNVGDTIVNHNYPKPDPTPPQPPQQPVVVQSSTSTIPQWFLLAIFVCALLGAGALWWLATQSRQQPTQPPPVFDVIVSE